jgi:hypothetical protein
MRVELSEGRRLHHHRVSLDGRVLADGHGAVVCSAARVLIDEGHDPAARLEAWRGDMLCLSGPLSAFAARTVAVSAEGRPKLVKWHAKGQTGALGGDE